MNLDRILAQVTGDQLKAVLLALVPRLDGLSADEIDDLCAEVAALEADDDVLFEPAISYEGEDLPFVVDVFKDAEGALEAVFMLPPVLTSLVRDAACAVVGAAAVRSMVAEQTADSESWAVLPRVPAAERRYRWAHERDMSLDAWVNCDCYERGLVTVPAAFAGRVHVEADGSLSLDSSNLNEQLQFDQWRYTACRHEDGVLLHHHLGNIAGVALLRQELQNVHPGPAFVLGRVVYDGVHSGDMISVAELQSLEQDLELLRSVRSEPIARLTSNLTELVRAAASVRKPILF